MINDKNQMTNTLTPNPSPRGRGEIDILPIVPLPLGEGEKHKFSVFTISLGEGFGFLPRFIWILIFGLWILFTTGCARTVTQMPTFGNEMAFEITLQGNYDVINNKYFIVFSTMEGYQIALPQPDGMDEFLVPGDIPQPGGISTQEYFSKYYSTWAGVILVDSQGYQLLQGPFNINNPVTREVFATLDNASNKLQFNININRIYGNTLPNLIYIDIISTSYPTGTFKSLKDRISPPAYSFEPIKGSVISYNDTDSSVNPVTDPSLNITNWKVTLP